MSKIKWVEYDRERKVTTGPRHPNPVWIMEMQYEDGVTIGSFDGQIWQTWNGSDDCLVTHWAEIDYPGGPE